MRTLANKQQTMRKSKHHGINSLHISKEAINNTKDERTRNMITDQDLQQAETQWDAELKAMIDSKEAHYLEYLKTIREA